MMNPSPKYIIGIGASAGGLEAIEELFNCLPKTDDLTFILVQHLSPDFKSVMKDLLSHHTTMPIDIAKNDQTLQAGRIYLIPATFEAEIINGAFKLSKINRKAPHMPINTLLTSLAIHSKQDAIGVILSGTGSDGALGMVSIAQHNGLTIVQNPYEAKFTDMPNYALATKEVNYVLSASEIPNILLEYAHHPADINKSMKQIEPIHESEYSDLFHLLNRQYQSNFNAYKIGTVSRRIQRRMRLLGIENLPDYVAYLSQNHADLKTLYQDLFIGVTSFFRDSNAFHVLETEVIPELFSRIKKNQTEIRVWVAACSSGEEAYSVAMLLKKYTDEHHLPFSVKLFASDVFSDLILKAKKGRYTPQEVAGIPSELLNLYFIKHSHDYEIIPEIRRQILFTNHNLLSDPPFTKLDLICCRNFLIYIKAQEQKRILDILRFSLNIGGFLFIGPSEGLTALKPDLCVINQAWKIFKKIKPSEMPPISPMVAQRSFAQNIPSPTQNLSPTGSLPLFAYNAILQEVVSSGFIIDASYVLLHSIGQARDMILLPEGTPTLILPKIIIDDLKVALIAALHQAKIKSIAVVYDHITIHSNQGTTQSMKMSVHPVCDNHHNIAYYWIRLDPAKLEKQDLFVISNQDKAIHHDEIIIALEGELTEARTLLQSALENMETVNEEMQSTNEELMASNEELQSTNEELRSVNEELNIVNLERSKKIDEVIQAKNDIDNLIRSAEICAIILNAKLEIRIFTPGIKNIFQLMEHDIGRSLENFQHNLKFDLLLTKAEEVLKNNRVYETEIRTHDNHWYLLRIIPYHAIQSKIVTGVVITFTDINKIKCMQQEKDDIEKNLRLALKTGLIGIWQCNVSDQALSYDTTIKNIFGLPSINAMHQLRDLIANVHLDDKKRIENSLEACIAQHEPFEQNFRIIRPDGSIRHLSCSASVEHNLLQDREYLTGICWDITEKYWLEEKIIDAQHLNIGLDAITDGWWDWNLITNKAYLSPLLKKTLGYEDHELPNRMESYEQLMLPKDLQSVKLKMAEYIANNSDYPMIHEIRFRHKSGLIIYLLSRRKGVLDKQKKLVRMIGTLTNINALKEYAGSLEKLAYLDFLTQVSNKPAFSDALHRAIARSKRTKIQFGVLYIDVDNFKQINDKWGHDYGDAVLCKIASVLKNSLRMVDLLARLGGDEFAILTEDICSQQEVLEIAKRHLAAFSYPLLINQMTISISISMGIVLYQNHGETPQKLLELADQAMYLAKKQGKNQVVLG